MNPAKRKRLQAAGWKVGTPTDLLGLTPNEALLIEVKLALADAVRVWRTKLGLTQAELGRRMRSSQSRVAKIEACAGSISLDLLVHALASLGVTQKQLARLIATPAA